MDQEHKDFEFSYVATDEAAARMDINKLEDWLNEKLQLQDYGTGISKIFFTFIAVPPNNPIHENEVFFREEDLVLEGALKLDYDALLDGTDEEVEEMMHQLFLSLLKIDTVQLIPDFDFDLFLEDLRELFGFEEEEEEEES